VRRPVQRDAMPLLNKPRNDNSDKRRVYVYSREELGVLVPPKSGCAGQMWCIEHELPEAIKASSIATRDKNLARLFIVAAVHSLSRNSNGVGTDAFKNDSHAILQRLQHASPHWNASGGVDHIWISAMSYPLPPRWAWENCILWLSNGDVSLWTRMERDFGLAQGSIAKRTVIIPASMTSFEPPPLVETAERPHRHASVPRGLRHVRQRFFLQFFLLV